MAGLSDTLQEDIQLRIGLFSGRKARRVREALQGYLFILPATIILVLFHFLPVLYAFYISLHKWFIVKGDYVGFANYTRALTTDRFWNSLKVTMWYVVGTVPIQLLLALVIAYLLFQKIRGKEGLRMVYFLPYVTSTVASGAVFAKMFNPTFGPINKALDAIGLPVLRWMKEPRGIFTVLGEMWGINVPFGGPSVALVTVMFFVIWFWVGYDATIFLAGLGAIPYELYEAAKIDGAGRWQLFRSITIPLLGLMFFRCVCYGSSPVNLLKSIHYALGMLHRNMIIKRVLITSCPELKIGPCSSHIGLLLASLLSLQLGQIGDSVPDSDSKITIVSVWRF